MIILFNASYHLAVEKRLIERPRLSHVSKGNNYPETLKMSENPQSLRLKVSAGGGRKSIAESATPKKLFLMCCAAFGMVVLSAQANSSPSPPPALLPLLMTLNDRLNMGDLVALSKWDSGKPIQDSIREAQVIDGAKKLALDWLLDQDAVGELIAAQMEANKLVQYGLLAEWQAAGKAPDVPRPDLANQVRPRLDELQKLLLHHYADFLPYRDDPLCMSWIAQLRPRLTKDNLHKIALIRATGEICASNIGRA